MKPNIALTGLARSGKDSVAARLVEDHGYVRVAFADKLKEAALKANPIAVTDDDYWDVPGTRLVDVVEGHGWEAAKDRFPEVRRFLQDYGQAIRETNPYFWITTAWSRIYDAWDDGRPVVVTDVRYTNEADFLTESNFTLVRVTRPGLVPGQHLSEREMQGYQADVELANDGTLADLARKAVQLIH